MIAHGMNSPRRSNKTYYHLKMIWMRVAKHTICVMQIAGQTMPAQRLIGRLALRAVTGFLLNAPIVASPAVQRDGRLSGT